MFKKTLIAHFLTTLNISMVLESIKYLTYKYNKILIWENTKLLENNLKKYLNCKNSEIISFYNWRSALYNCFKILNLNKNDEVIIQWYTCISVINSIIQAWLKPVYVDIDDTCNININLIQQHVTKKTKVLIVQHTFWNPADILTLKNIAKDNNLVLIEDCAHTLWSEFNWQKIWTFWDFWIFSFWRDKVISSVNWGFLVINNLKYKQNIKLVNINKKEIIKNLFYNIIWFIAYKTYNILHLWKIILFLSTKYNLFPKIISASEKQCNYSKLNYSYPNSLAWIWIKELQKINYYNLHRHQIAKIYLENIHNKNITFIPKIQNSKINNYMFMIRIVDIKKVINYCKKYNILLWNYWSWTNIVPLWSTNSLYNNNCFKALEISNSILQLPTHSWISEKNALYISKILNEIN